MEPGLGGPGDLPNGQTAPFAFLMTNVASSHYNHTVNDKPSEWRPVCPAARATKNWVTDLLELRWSGDIEVSSVNVGDSEGERDDKRLCEHV